MPSAAKPHVLQTLDRAALVSLLLLPLLLLHAHGIAEVAIAVADLFFLLRSALVRDWGWLRTPWIRVAGLWWLWQLTCSLLVPALHLGEGGAPALVQALAMVRFYILAACLEHWLLKPVSARRWLFGLVAE